MKIELKNIGVLKQGSLTAKPLTILCGANNTGKTYALYVLYGFLRRLRGVNMKIAEIDEQAMRLIEDDICEINAVEMYRKYAQSLATDVGDRFSRHLDKFFQVPASSLTDPGIKVQLSDSEDDATEMVRPTEFVREFSAKVPGYRQSNLPMFRAEKKADSDILQLKLLVDVTTPDDARRAKTFIKYCLRRLFFAPQLGQVFLLPAERAGINIFQKELVAKRVAYFHSMLTDDAADDDIEDHVALYPEPIADYIDFLNQLEWFGNDEGVLNYLATELENDILGGTYAVADGDIKFVSHQSQQPINLHMSSSTVKTYFGLWFYLRHMAAPGDCLMIDEPELSLHPDNQRKVARVLTKLVNSGVQVVLSTHSDYIVKEFNNHIMLSESFDGRDELMAQFGYEPSHLLVKEKVGAYTFSKGEIRPMEIDPDEGIIAATFDEVINRLNASSNEIYYARKSSQDSVEDKNGESGN